MPSTTEPKIETKSVKHVFTPEEKNAIGQDLAQAIATHRNVQAELDQVKAMFKAKVTECEAKIDTLSTTMINGWDMRNERCVVIFRPKDRQKDYVLEADFAKNNGKSTVVLTEEMTNDDFQAELVQAESKFECREEIPLFPATETEHGILVVGRLAGKWFSALRVKIGRLTLDERLDSEQKACKQRADAILSAVKRVNVWAKEALGRETAKGFEDHFSAAYESQKERVE